MMDATPLLASDRQRYNLPAMSAILDLPEMRALVARWSVKDYERLGEEGILDQGVELIRGVIVQKMSKSPVHRALTKQIYDFFMALRLAGYVVFQEAPLRLADSEPEPDAAIVRGEESDFAERHPTTAELVVEVAISSAVLDRENASMYAEAGVREYWIVLKRERAVEVYRQPEHGIYRQKRLYAAGETLVCESVPGVNAPLAEWFA